MRERDFDLDADLPPVASPFPAPRRPETSEPAKVVRMEATRRKRSAASRPAWLAGTVQDERGRALPILANAALALRQDARFEVDPWEQTIADFIRGRDRVQVHEVARDGLLISDHARIGTRESRRIGAILSRLGWTQGRDKTARFYQRPKLRGDAGDAGDA